MRLFGLAAVRPLDLINGLMTQTHIPITFLRKFAKSLTEFNAWTPDGGSLESAIRQAKTESVNGIGELLDEAIDGFMDEQNSMRDS